MSRLLREKSIERSLVGSALLQLVRGDGVALIERGVDAERAVELAAYFEQRAAVPALSTDDLGGDTFESELAVIDQATAHHGLFATMLQFAVPGRFRTKHSVLLACASTADTEQGMGRPVVRGATASKVMVEREAMTIVVLSRGMERRMPPETMTQVASVGIALAQDDQLVGHLLSTAATVGTVGSNAQAIYLALKIAAMALNTRAASVLVIGAGAGLCKRLAFMPDGSGSPAFPLMTPSGGTIGNVPVVCTDALAENVVLMDASAFVARREETIFDRADETSLELATDPSSASNDGGSPPQPVETTLTSLWQTNCVGLKARSLFGFAPLRDNVAVVIEGAGVTWGYDGSTSPPL